MRTFTSKAFACLFMLGIALSIRPAFADGFEAQNAFQAQSSFTLGPTFSEVCSTVATVPAKKRFVIEYVSATVGPVPMGTSLRFVQLRTGLAGAAKEGAMYHNVTQNFVGSLEVVFGQRVKLYADGIVVLCVARTGNNLQPPLPVESTVSGYLVDIP
jgi:hypothetical protein